MIRTAGNTTRLLASRLAGLLAVVCVGGLAAGVSPALGAFPGDNGKIAFESARDGDDIDIWTMSPNGRHPANLTADSEGFDGLPNWRADGRKIAFMSDRVTTTNPEADFEIFVMNADGSDLTQLTRNALDDENPAWSPNGKQLVYQRDFDPIDGEVDYDIFTMQADGTHERRLTESPGVQDVDANWSPNGRHIAFSSDRDGDGEIYTMKPDGSRVRQLTFNDGPSDVNPNWSPDGRKIAFDSDRDAVAETPFQNEIYTMHADGDDQTRLTFHDLSDVVPAWSPDGRKIAFTSFRDATEENHGNAEVYTMRADGSNQVNRTNNPALDLGRPDWQPLNDHDHHDDD